MMQRTPEIFLGHRSRISAMPSLAIRTIPGESRELRTTCQFRCGLTKRNYLNQVGPLFNHPYALLDIPERAYSSGISDDGLMRARVSVQCVQVSDREKVIEDIDFHWSGSYGLRLIVMPGCRTRKHLL